MTTLDDPRPFSVVLSDWIGRHGGSAYAAGPILRTTPMTVGRWLNGSPCAHEYAYRGLMTLLDGVTYNDSANSTASTSAHPSGAAIPG